MGNQVVASVVFLDISLSYVLEVVFRSVVVRAAAGLLIEEWDKQKGCAISTEEGGRKDLPWSRFLEAVRVSSCQYHCHG
jgi:hypothetical protein